MKNKIDPNEWQAIPRDSRIGNRDTSEMDIMRFQRKIHYIIMQRLDRKKQSNLPSSLFIQCSCFKGSNPFKSTQKQ